MPTITYFVVNSYDTVVSQPFATREAAYIFAQKGWDYRIVPATKSYLVGEVVSKSDWRINW